MTGFAAATAATPTAKHRQTERNHRISRLDLNIGTSANVESTAAHHSRAQGPHIRDEVVHGLDLTQNEPPEAAGHGKDLTACPFEVRNLTSPTSARGRSHLCTVRVALNQCGLIRNVFNKSASIAQSETQNRERHNETGGNGRSTLRT